MNKKMLLLFAGISSLITLAVVTVFLFVIYKAEVKSITRISSDIHTSYLQEIIYNYKNDLVSGNYRSFRNQLSSLISNDIFSGYRIVQEGDALDSSDDFELKVSSRQFTTIRIPVWFDEERKNLWGYVELLVNTRSQTKFMAAIFEKIVPLLCIVFLMIAFLVGIYSFIWQRFNFSLVKEVDKIFKGTIRSNNDLGLLIWKPMLTRLRALKNSSDELQKRDESNRTQQFLIQLSKQVAHDIRSPLSTLNIIMHNETGMNIERQQLVKSSLERINSIANDLLDRDKAVTNNFQSQQVPQLKNTRLNSIVESMLNEKKILYSKMTNVSFEYDKSDSADAIVGDVSSELGRILSNLINNSVEAFLEQTGKVSIRIARYSDHALLVVRDNGVGIPDHVLSQLGSIEISHGKENTKSGPGSGLGILHAKKTVLNWGGNFQIKSKVGIGTMVEIKLPLAQV